MPWAFNPFTGRLDYYVAATPATHPAGLDTEIQYNDEGSFGSTSKFTYDKVSSTVKIGEGVTPLPDNPLAVQANVDSYLQINLQNDSTHADASADYIVTADDGDDENYWGDFGICNSGYDSEIWDVSAPHDAYLMVDGGNLVLGTLTSTKVIKFFIANTDHEGHPADVIGEFDADGLNLVTGMTYRINGVDILASGMSNPMTASGDIIYGGTAGAPTALAKGTDGKILTLVSGLPSWEPNSGTYTDEDAQDAVGAMADANSLTYTDGTPLLEVKVQQSITKDSSGLKLSGDSATPGNNMVYGTDGSGVKGWKADPAGATAFTKDVIGVTVDGAGSVITTGSKGYKEIQEACTITGWTILGHESGSVVIDVKKCTYAAHPTASSIAGSEKPTLSSAQKNQNLTLTTWTTSLSAGDLLEFYVESATTVTRVHLYIRISKA
jgi:hypothetical protein